MIEPYLVPFKAEHWMHFVQLGPGYQAAFAEALGKEKAGPAYTAICEDTILGCAGIIIHHGGMGYAWAVLSSIVTKGYAIWMTRIIKAMLRDIKRGYNLHRIELIVSEDQLGHQQWAERCLGFTREDNGVAKAYMPDKKNVIRYEMVEK